MSGKYSAYCVTSEHEQNCKRKTFNRMKSEFVKLQSEHVGKASSKVTQVMLVCQIPHLHDRKRPRHPEKRREAERGKEMFAVVR